VKARNAESSRWLVRRGCLPQNDFTEKSLKKKLQICCPFCPTIGWGYGMRLVFLQMKLRSLAIWMALLLSPGAVEASVMVSVSPVLRASQTLRMGANLTSANNTAVMWSVNPLVGTISSVGLYTAPATITSVQTVQISATSVQDPSQSVSLSILLRPTVSLTISPAQLVAQPLASQQFTTNLTGATDSTVVWSISPALGSVSTGGLYTAPASISSPQTVTVTATSVADPDSSASATITLQPPISVTVAPTSAMLYGGQSQQFTSGILNTSNTGVTWSLNPAVGTVGGSGIYTAPAAITSTQTVSVVAASVADPTKSAAAVITLQPTVIVSVAPGTATLSAAQAQQFSVSVSGASNTAVTWTLNPAVGTLSNGLYTAPAFVTSSQTVTVTATSTADATKSAAAQITLQPTIAVSISPASASLSASQTQQFTPTVTGTGTTTVTWSLNPSLGTISTAGLYTAPATITAPQQVVVMATSTVDTTKSGQVSILLNPPAPPRPITLPVEVMGANGTTVAAVVNVPTVPSGSNTMQMRVHGVKYETEASVQVNGSTWVPLNSATVTLLGNAKAFGGIGGGFNTLDLTVPVPAGTIVAGNNTINFRFNATDGRTSGFRVLSFNFLDPNGKSLVPSTAFVQDDPSTWQPPFSDATNIAAGQALWRGASLTVPQSTGPASILATCGSCHTQDGRDLKYFNYSNNAIIARSVFHGLTAQQGQQIASYIRTLPVNNPGRPWNPPYQPGPGLDSQPVSNWAAGAGLDAVVNNYQDQLNDLFPGGIQDSVFSAQGTVNQREIRVPFQLMDWNEWLPSVHPMDAFGAAFTNSMYNTTYQTLRATLKVGDATTYSSGVVQQLFSAFDGYRQEFWMSFAAARESASFWTPYNTAVAYSVPLWGMVKSWELNNEFQLEGLAQAFYGPQGSPRAWAGNFPFNSSPNIDKIPPTNLKNGLQSTHDYVAFTWYHLQLILNDSNKQDNNTYPIDFGYVYGMISAMASMVHPASALHYEWLIRGLQIENNGIGPDLGGAGWQWPITNFVPLVEPPNWTWVGESLATRAALAEGFVKSWLAVVTGFTPQQFYKGGWATAAEVPIRGLTAASSGRFIDALWYSIPQLRNLGVSQIVINQAAAWAQTIWPQVNWSATTTATCTAGSWPVCSTEQ